MSSFWIILTGCLVASSCAILGCYLVLRKMSMVADAIAHAILPGIVIAFLVSGSKNSVPMLIGAAAFGVLCTFLIEFFHKKVRLQKDASIGLTFTWLFSLGVILISLFAGQADLDQECVLYGEIAYVPFDVTYYIGQIGIPTPTIILLGMLIVVLLFVFLGYKALFLTTFDQEYAIALGISTTLWHYFLMTMVSLTTVVSFESVGAILVIAFMIVPASTAYLLTNQLKSMLLWAIAFGVVASIIGYFFAELINGSIAAAISTVLGFQFVLVFLFEPKNGVITKHFTSKKVAIH